MISKKTLKHFLLDLGGLTYYKWKKAGHGLYIFNYHRVGDAANTPFDPNVFSCNTQRFEQHLKFYKKHFVMLHMDELQDVISKGKEGKFGLITFDDGYVDNYQNAFPLLLKENLSATFFVTTDYVESNLIPSWDEVAFMVKSASVSQINISGTIIEIDKHAIGRTIRLVLNQFKKDTRSIPEKLAAYSAWLQPTVPLQKQQLFMSWAQLLEMQSHGMSVGSHSCSHNILSHLSDDQQRYEIFTSKQILEDKLLSEIYAIAYPVGGYNCFNETTCSLIKEAGYRYAFSFTNELNRLNTLNPYSITRIGIEDNMDVYALQRKIAFCNWI